MTQTHYVALLYICQFSGLLMVIGGIALIYKQKIDINRVTKSTEITVPFFGKLRTNSPALALFMIGFIPLLYPVEKLKTEFLHVQQDVKSNVHPGRQSQCRVPQHALISPLVTNATKLLAQKEPTPSFDQDFFLD